MSWVSASIPRAGAIIRAISIVVLAFLGLASTLLNLGALLVILLAFHMMAKTGQFHGMVFTPRQIRDSFGKFTLLTMLSAWLAFWAIRKLFRMYPPDIAQIRR
jgi:hypothetical protein